MHQQLNIYGQTKEEQAIEFIKVNEPKDEPYMLCYSGGKDSVVLEDLTRKANVSYVVYYTLLHDPPELIKFIRSRPFEINVIKAQNNFYKMVETWFPPHRKTRWCCNYLKEDPSKKIPLTYRLLGIRAEESKSRAKRGWIDQYTKRRIHYHPLFDWLEWEIWDYIDKYKLPYCSLYDEGFSRLGCVVCPLRSAKEKQIWKKRWPAQHELFEKACRRWWDRKGFHRQRIRGFVYFFDEAMKDWYQQ